MTDTDIDEEAVTMLRMAEEPSPRWRSPESISSERSTIKKRHSEPAPARATSPAKKGGLLSRGRSRQSKANKILVEETHRKNESASPATDNGQSTFTERVLRPKAVLSRNMEFNSPSRRFSSASQQEPSWPSKSAAKIPLNRASTAPVVPTIAKQDTHLHGRLLELEGQAALLRSRQFLLISMIPDGPTDLSVHPISDSLEESDERKAIYISWLSDIESEIVSLDNQHLENKTAFYYAQRERLEADEYLLQQLWSTPAESYRNASDEQLLDQMGRCNGWIKRLSIEQKSVEKSINRVKIALEALKVHGMGGNTPILRETDEFENPATDDANDSVAVSSDDAKKSLFSSWAGWSRAVSPAIIVASVSAGLLIVHNKQIIEDALHVSLEMMFTIISFSVGIAGIVGVLIFLIRIATSDKWKILFDSSTIRKVSNIQETGKKQNDSGTHTLNEIDAYLTSMETDSDSETPSPMNVSSPLHSVFSSGTDMGRRASYNGSTGSWNPSSLPSRGGPPIYPVMSNPVKSESRQMPADENKFRNIFANQMAPHRSAFYSLPRLRSPFRARRPNFDMSNPTYVAEKPVRSSSVRAPKHLFADPSKVIFHRHLAGVPRAVLQTSQEGAGQAEKSPSPNYGPYADDNSCKPYGQPPARYQGALT